MVRTPRGGNNPSLTAHTLTEVLHDGYITTGWKDVVTARKLKNGDTIITIDSLIIWYTKNEGWVEKAFGEGVATAKRTYVIIAKGMPTQMVRRDRNALREGILREN